MKVNSTCLILTIRSWSFPLWTSRVLLCAGSPAVCALVGGAEVDSNNWVELNESL